MEQNQHKQSHSAEQKLQETLAQLEDILPESSTEVEAKAKLTHGKIDKVELIEDLIDIDLAELEDAVADIEEYLDKKAKK
ncbi:hypothetical protein [Nodularia sphaerocarpa]|uniref:hypothetical protein n=1 Tax=Nodularia sphaerocarpa TaxID=137816 RepID=UPI001EFBC3FE|nr:hypothetical protein [Nodularia sphaerocarpa]MDB9372844.1 hypothetical protein [Nodularia sphaerocarpa CS-585]MDB9379337.1 hypothetical protein [Nodularia sphaerocarpa CS-585A2]ULP73565.1 hypothetical protein BDGGKGIB_03222 [Nodularia sphaerocarpa UHCC 0038]